MIRLPLEGVAVGDLGPPLKWAGGKRWLVPRLRELLSAVDFERLVEPFVGGLAVALGLRPHKALLRDANPHLINFYKWLKRGLDLTGLGIQLTNDTSIFYQNRERFNALARSGKIECAEAAALFYYLNRTAFNGLCRFNRRGEFNVPFGRYSTIAYRTDFREYKNAFSNFTFETGDFQDMAPSGGDLVYADPPYDVQFTSYSANGFSWEDQVRLAKWLSGLSVPVLASNQATDRVLDLYQRLGFSIETLNAPRRISCTGDRSEALEILAHIRLR
ncbi:MAG TPA: Dam family site-specific DNA-(adenine-N6)-methyltransferase [Candidatus Tumulicola sp.]|jgi:DNA adenine methylase